MSAADCTLADKTVPASQADATTVQSITILGGQGRDGQPEPVRQIDLRMGEIVSIVGPTGSGKTTLINDLELFANGDTPTGRTILFDGGRPSLDLRDDPARHPIALITQHTTFLSDMPVGEFLATHARVRGADRDNVGALVEEVLSFANQLTGEPVNPRVRMTELSGGQTRALLIADAAVICATPIVLLDEVENAGINRTRAIELLRRYRKIFIFVTHDPRIVLLSDFRIVMQAGSITEVLRTDAREKLFSERVGRLDDALSFLRDQLRQGQRLTGDELGSLL